MAGESNGAGVFGSSIRRREDPELITGQAKYTDDLQLPNTAYCTILRSDYAHAKINSIEAHEAIASSA